MEVLSAANLQGKGAFSTLRISSHFASISPDGPSLYEYDPPPSGISDDHTRSSRKRLLWCPRSASDLICVSLHLRGSVQSTDLEAPLTFELRELCTASQHKSVVSPRFPLPQGEGWANDLAYRVHWESDKLAQSWWAPWFTPPSQRQGHYNHMNKKMTSSVQN